MRMVHTKRNNSNITLSENCMCQLEEIIRFWLIVRARGI